MSFTRLGALVAALSVACMPLAARAGDTDAPVPGMTGPQIDAQAQLDALKDIPPNSWAYQSIVELVNDGIVVGYPDGTFKGERPLTRHEAAIIVERAVQYLTKQLANPQTAPSVSPADVATLRNLLDEFHQGDADGYAIGYAGVHYWFSRFGRIGLVYQGSDVLNGTDIPVASTTWAGVYLTHDISHGPFLQTSLQF
jgi:hypothetical protein